MEAPVNSFKQLPHRIYDVVRPIILRANYFLGRYESAIWLFGDGRSGTTFVADLIKYNRCYRELFEPFHPKFVKAMQGLQLHQYMKPGMENQQLTKSAADIFSGFFVDQFVDSSSTRLAYRNLIIKDIFVNLLARWALDRFENHNIKPVLLIRNPYAVALSKYKKCDWEWMTDPRDFLKQEKLVEDYLYPFVDEIKAIGDDYIVRQIMIWAIIHYVPFKQFRDNELHVLFYENLLSNPEEELESLLFYLDIPVSEKHIKSIIDIMSRPSRVSGPDSSILRGDSPVESWRAEVTESQIINGEKVLKTFGLDHIYAQSTTPKVLGTDLLLKD